LAENPKHGDEIIVQQRSSLGKTKLVANRQLQQFFDELGTVVNEFVSSNDVIQQLALNDSQTNNLKPAISRLIKTTEDNSQQISMIDSFLQHVVLRTRRLSGNIENNSQQIAVIDSGLSSVAKKERALSSRIDDLEQLAHVN